MSYALFAIGVYCIICIFLVSFNFSVYQDGEVDGWIRVFVPLSPTLPRVLCDFYQTFRGFTVRGKSPFQGHSSANNRSFVIKVYKKGEIQTRKKERVRKKVRKRG